MTQAILDNLQHSLWIDARGFLPELILCATIVLLLLARLMPSLDRIHLGRFACLMTLLAALVAWEQWNLVGHFNPIRETGEPPLPRIDLFGGMLLLDSFALFVKMFLYGFTALVVLLSVLTGIPDREDSADFYTLLLGAAVGMAVMASANHLLMVYLGIEMASLPSYALAGFQKGRRQSSEAALKYVVYGGGAAGVMLYGISLIAGKYGTGYLPDVLRFISAGPLDPVVIMGVLFILIGIGFKLSAFPFHFWCPDVFEGAPAEVGAFLSVASKGAALALLARIALGLAGLAGGRSDAETWELAAPYLVPVLSVFAVVTTTFGNLAAYMQTNLKRLLAYSTIAHAGFMMMGLAALTREGVAAVLVYLVVYLFMNLGAFTAVAFLRNLTGSEDLRDFRGLARRMPLLVITLGFFLLSLLGMPPLAGFVAKFQIFAALFDAATLYTEHGQIGLSWTLYAVLIAAGLNTVLSLFYYVKVLKVMVLERSVEEVEGQPVPRLPLPWIHSIFLSVLAASLLVLFVWWDPLAEAARGQGTDTFRQPPAAARSAQAPAGGEGAE